MTSTTGTSIESYLEWVRRELLTKRYGKVSIQFTVCGSQVTDVEKTSIDTEHYPLRAIAKRERT